MYCMLMPASVIYEYTCDWCHQLCSGSTAMQLFSRGLNQAKALGSTLYFMNN